MATRLFLYEEPTMTHSALVTSQELAIREESHLIKQSSSKSLRQSVRVFLKARLMQFDASFSDLYSLILAEIELPMLEVVLQYTGQNQSKAARILSMSRGTLRKKMQYYGLLSQSKKQR